MGILQKKKGFICDMDGVIYHGNNLLPGVKEFVDWLTQEKKNYLFLTNSSQYTPRSFSRSWLGWVLTQMRLIFTPALWLRPAFWTAKRRAAAPMWWGNTA